MLQSILRSALVLALLVSPALAQPWLNKNAAVQAMTDAKSNCKVFAPLSVQKSLPFLTWSGACRDGFAEGAGTASFAALAGGQPSKTWEGNFHSGFFTGNVKASGQMQAPGGSSVLIEFPTNAPAEGTYWVVTAWTHDAPVQTCGLGAAEVLVEAPADLSPSDDARIRQMMSRAVVFYRQACAGPITMRLVVVPPQGQQGLATASFSAIEKRIAEAQVGTGASPDSLANFKNIATGESDQGKKQAAAKEKKQQSIADGRAAWLTLSQKNKVTLWVTPQLIGANPFRFGDRIVAFPGHFNEMIEPGVAKISDAKGGRIVVTGVPNDAFAKPQDAIFVGKVSGQRDVAISSRTTVKEPAVELIALQPCARKGCLDYLEWMDDEKPPFPWGEDQAKYLTP